MPRPSRNVDIRLLAAGRELYPETGAAGLSLRKVAERAGANVGMFHYHFGSKDAFVRALLQSLYEEMFADLEVAAADVYRPLASLRAALTVIARFGRDHRQLLKRLLADAVIGEPAAVDFVRDNVPRHVRIIVGLVAAAQRAGDLKPMPIVQAVMFIAGSVVGPVLLGSAIAESPLAPPGLAQRFEAEVLTDAALAERIDLALAGLAPAPGGTG